MAPLGICFIIFHVTSEHFFYYHSLGTQDAEHSKYIQNQIYKEIVEYQTHDLKGKKISLKTKNSMNFSRLERSTDKENSAWRALSGTDLCGYVSEPKLRFARSRLGTVLALLLICMTICLCLYCGCVVYIYGWAVTTDETSFSQSIPKSPFRIDLHFFPNRF